MPKVLANGIDIHYQRVGKGPDLVMIHGLTGNLAVWHLKLVGLLQKDFRITTYDLRGHGYTDVPRDGYTTRSMAGDLDGLLDALEIENPYVVGHSFGADVALHHTLLHPGRLKRIVAAEVGLAAMIHIRKREEWEGWRYWREALAKFGVPVPRDKWFDPEFMLKLSLRVPKIYGPATGRARKAEPLMKLLQGTTMLIDYENEDGFTLDKIEEINTPIKLVYGENSAFLGTYEYLKEHLPNRETVLLPHSEFGHFGPVEQPELFVEHIKDFCKEDDEAVRTESDAVAELRD